MVNKLVNKLVNKQWIACILTLLFSGGVAANTLIIPETQFWTGAYAGGFVGGASGPRIKATEPLRLDNNAFWFRPFHNSFSFRTRPSFIGGLTLGYNWQSDLVPLLLGLEGEYSYLNLSRCKVDPNQFPYSNLPNNNLLNTSDNFVRIGKSGYGLIAARIGYVQDCTLFYIKTGPIFTKIQSLYNSVKTEDGNLAYLSLAGSKRITGYGIGAGIEYMLPFEGISNLSTKIEYLYMGLNKKQYVYGHCSCHFLWRTIERIRGFHTLKIGINYKFC